jgi:hypothetical protein
MQETQAHVCQHVGCGVTVTNPRAKYCTNACRQAAYRTSPAHAARLATFRSARKLRRETHFKFKHRASSLHPYRGYGGPVPAGMPARFGGLDLRPFLAQAREAANV